MAEVYCQVASTELNGGLRPDRMGQMSILWKPQATFADFLTTAAQRLSPTQERQLLRIREQDRKQN